MGFLDNVQSTFNRGVAAAGRTTDTVRLKAQMADALKELDTQQLAYISGAIQMARMMSSMKKRSADHPEPKPA